MTPSKAHPPRFHIYLDAEPDDYGDVPALRAFRMKRHHGFRDTTEYLSLSEHEALLAEARADTFEECASYLYTTDSSNEQHELVDELARDLRALAKAAAQAPGAVEGEKNER
jgi:hypothetical protein